MGDSYHESLVGTVPCSPRPLEGGCSDGQNHCIWWCDFFHHLDGWIKPILEGRRLVKKHNQRVESAENVAEVLVCAKTQLLRGNDDDFSGGVDLAALRKEVEVLDDGHLDVAKMLVAFLLPHVDQATGGNDHSWPVLAADCVDAKQQGSEGLARTPGRRGGHPARV